MVILEALSVGCPVVASSNIPDLPDCLKVVDIDDKPGWKDAIADPITQGPEQAVTKHHVDIVSKQWGEIYDRIIDSNASTE